MILLLPCSATGVHDGAAGHGVGPGSVAAYPAIPMLRPCHPTCVPGDHAMAQFGLTLILSDHPHFLCPVGVLHPRGLGQHKETEGQRMLFP